LDVVLSRALGPWRASSARRDAGKVLLDFAMTLGVGCDGCADPATAVSDADVVTSSQAGAKGLAHRLHGGASVPAVGGSGVADAFRDRGEPVVFGAVASDRTVSSTSTRLPGDLEAALMRCRSGASAPRGLPPGGMLGVLM
jgi:hypothetical protein